MKEYIYPVLATLLAALIIFIVSRVWSIIKKPIESNLSKYL